VLTGDKQQSTSAYAPPGSAAEPGVLRLDACRSGWPLPRYAGFAIVRGSGPKSRSTTAPAVIGWEQSRGSSLTPRRGRAPALRTGQPGAGRPHAAQQAHCRCVRRAGSAAEQRSCVDGADSPPRVRRRRKHAGRGGAFPPHCSGSAAVRGGPAPSSMPPKRRACCCTTRVLTGEEQRCWPVCKSSRMRRRRGGGLSYLCSSTRESRVPSSWSVDVVGRRRRVAERSWLRVGGGCLSPLRVLSASAHPCGRGLASHCCVAPLWLILHASPSRTSLRFTCSWSVLQFDARRFCCTLPPRLVVPGRVSLARSCVCLRTRASPRVSLRCSCTLAAPLPRGLQLPLCCSKPAPGASLPLGCFSSLWCLSLGF
jgi:hypothetical protein